jgi:hypothetical protein
MRGAVGAVGAIRHWPLPKGSIKVGDPSHLHFGYLV